MADRVAWPLGEACGEDAGCEGHDVRPGALKYQFQNIAQQSSAYNRCQDPKGARPLARHKEINGHRAYDDAEYGITAQGSDVPGRLLDPWRPDGVGQIIDAAEKEKDGLIEFCSVALNHLLGNMAKCKHEGRNGEKGHQRPGFSSVRAH